MMEVAVTHVSTACVLLEVGSLHILTDPVLDEGVKVYRFAPGSKAERRVGPTLLPGQLPLPDVVLLSHTHHQDNLDETGASVARQARRVITGPAGGGPALGDRVERIAAWQATTVQGDGGEQVHVTATPARHGPWWLPGTRKVVGFVLEWPGQQHGAVYVSGDTVFFRGIRQVAERFRVGTALLHLGAVNFWPPWPPFIRFTFSGREAARAAKLLGARTVLPIHYEQWVWSHFKESVESYRREFEKAGVASAVQWLEHGKRTVVVV
jgi:L-ascorbate metabolism protein UlaG (beta-lactamase superfamily)